MKEIVWSDVVKKRSSVRRYDPLPIDEATLDKLENFADNLRGPFHPNVRFEFIHNANTPHKDRQKIGTYGFIHGAKHFIAGIVQHGTHDMEQLGYAFEHIILFATYLGLGTCWLGGTFNRKHLGRAVAVNKDEVLPAISPLGYKASKESMLSKAMKWSVKSKHRKPWEALFFHQDTDKPLSENEAEHFALPLEMVRLAPSATNNQPWRIIKDGEDWHFYRCESKFVVKSTPFNMQRIDLGIAMCHFELGAKEKKLDGKWVMLDEKPIFPGTEKWDYTVSWI